MNAIPEVLTAREASERIGVSEQRVRTLLRSGALEGQQLGKQWLTTEAAVMAYLKDGRLTATVEQFPGEQARQALRALVAFVRDGARPAAAELFIKPIVIDTKNLDKAEIKE